MERQHYPSDVTDEEWAFAAPYLTLMTPYAPQREHDLREVYNALRWVTRTGAQWRYIPHDRPPWAAVFQQARRWYDADVFDTMMHDLRVLLRIASGHSARQALRSLTAGLSNQHQKVVIVPATTVRNVERDQRSTRQSIRSGTCLHYMQVRLRRTIVITWGNSVPPSVRRQRAG